MRAELGKTGDLWHRDKMGRAAGVRGLEGFLGRVCWGSGGFLGLEGFAGAGRVCWSPKSLLGLQARRPAHNQISR